MQERRLAEALSRYPALSHLNLSDNHIGTGRLEGMLPQGQRFLTLIFKAIRSELRKNLRLRAAWTLVTWFY
jgi:hypothetical protein